MNLPGSVVEAAFDWLQAALAQGPRSVLLSSPFLTSDICKLIAEAASGSTGHWELVTALDPSAVAGGYLSVDGLTHMLNAGIDIRHVSRLHAKCFIVGDKALLGSANLTGAGLGRSGAANRELGVELTSDQTRQAREIITNWPARRVDRDDLNELLDQAKDLGQVPHRQEAELTAASALQQAEKLLLDARDQQRTLWVKLEYGQPALDGWRNDSWFASPKKGKPGFKPGDLVFICAKETHDCYAVVEVTSAPEYQPHDYLGWAAEADPPAAERWPWINRTKPRLVPTALLELKLNEIGVKGAGLQNGHVRIKFDQFTAGVRALARLATN